MTDKKRKCDGNKLKYMEIANDLIRDIFSGKYGPGDQLPTERALSEQYAVAHLTLRQALAVLQKRGLIVKKRSSGAYVSKQELIDQSFQPLGANADCIRVLGLHYDVRGRINPANWPIRLNVYQGIVEAAFFLGLPVRIHDMLPGHDTPDRIVDELAGAKGVILYGEAILPESVRSLSDAGIPMVGINLPGASFPCSMVNVDTAQGAGLAARHLLELGHRRIGFVGGLQTDPFMRKRFDGFKQAHDDRSVKLDERLLVFNTGGFPSDGAEAAVRLMNCPEPPTAIFAASDYRAIGILQKLSEMGVRVPEDVSVMGFDNIPESVHTVPPLSTIDNPLQRSGLEAVKMLYRRIWNPRFHSEKVVLKMQLLARSSTKSRQTN